jgi:hypothetical protein
MDSRKIQFGIRWDQQTAREVYVCCVSRDIIYEDNPYIEMKNGDIVKDDYETILEYIDGTRRYAGEEVDG